MEIDPLVPKIIEVFLFTIYGRGGHLGALNKLSFPLTMEVPHKFGFDWPRGLEEKGVLNCERTTDGRTDEPSATSFLWEIRKQHNRGVPFGAILFACGVPSGAILFAYTPCRRCAVGFC